MQPTATRIREAYETGRGVVVIRSKSHVEQIGKDEAIVITEIPYQQNKAALVDRIEVGEARKVNGQRICDVVMV